jgi:hypothetical protein
MKSERRASSKNSKASLQFSLGFRDSLPRDPMKRALEMAQIVAARERQSN